MNRNPLIITSVMAVIVALSGCATEPVTITQTFDDAEYAAYRKPGTGSISGQAFLKTVGGDVKYAAGSAVTLDPVTSYSREWFEKAGQTWAHRGELAPDPRFATFRKTTTADANGRFKFTNLPAGSYYVRTECTWVPYSSPVLPPDAYIQGGLLWLEVTLADGEQKEVVVAGH